MSFNLYNEYAERALKATAPNLATADIKIIFVDSSLYTFDQAHDFLDDVPGGARVDDPVALTDRTCEAGVFRAADISTSLPDGAGTVNAVIGYYDSGVEATSLLIFYNDQSPDLPFTADGNSRQLRWNAGEGEIFRLVRVAPPL